MMLFEHFKKKKNSYIRAVVDGKRIPVQDIKDDMFAQQILGKTFAIEPEGDCITAPVDGVLEVMYPSGHAFAIRMNDGNGIMVHIGINTFNEGNFGFSPLCEQGQVVSVGQAVVQINRKELKSKGMDLTTMIIFTKDQDDKTDIEFVVDERVKQGDIIGRLI